MVGWFCWDGFGSIDEVAKLARYIYTYHIIICDIRV